jgi:hypothetical protein
MTHLSMTALEWHGKLCCHVHWSIGHSFRMSAACSCSIWGQWCCRHGGARCIMCLMTAMHHGPLPEL